MEMLAEITGIAFAARDSKRLGECPTVPGRPNIDGPEIGKSIAGSLLQCASAGKIDQVIERGTAVVIILSWSCHRNDGPSPRIVIRHQKGNHSR